ncbi:AlbA family DNA-binding domain-containing protein [Paenibacillus gansuensis]|uniref:Helix-turn-helix domain-containing protein n=1 Tax=Paenibacillus gansuensis TaxID=306542 RepID=A0ABW5PI77_9BACL
MSLLWKPIDQITEQDIQSLFTNLVPESRVVALPNLQGGDNKREFVYDVTAFANGGGGELIFGIAEASGRPDRVVGVSIGNTDQLIRQVEEIIRTSVQYIWHSDSCGTAFIDRQLRIHDSDT